MKQRKDRTPDEADDRVGPHLSLNQNLPRWSPLKQNEQNPNRRLRPRPSIKQHLSSPSYRKYNTVFYRRTKRREHLLSYRNGEVCTANTSHQSELQPAAPRQPPHPSNNRLNRLTTLIVTMSLLVCWRGAPERTWSLRSEEEVQAEHLIDPESLVSFSASSEKVGSTKILEDIEPCRHFEFDFFRVERLFEISAFTNPGLVCAGRKRHQQIQRTQNPLFCLFFNWLSVCRYTKYDVVM